MSWLSVDYERESLVFRLPDGTWVLFMDHPFGADPSWAVEAPPHTE